MTFFIEPLSIVGKNNKIEALKVAEEQEVNRIIREISEFIVENSDIAISN